MAQYHARQFRFQKETTRAVAAVIKILFCAFASSVLAASEVSTVNPAPQCMHKTHKRLHLSIFRQKIAQVLSR